MAISLSGCIPAGYAPYDYRPAPKRSDAQTVSRLPSTPPAWELRPVSADAKLVSASTYTVRHGDTLRGIANKTGAGSEAIARANHLSAPFTIYTGQKLTIPGGRYHRVKQGETGIAIARAYGVPWSQVIAANDLESPYILRVGQRILIPSTGPMTVAERAAAFNLDIEDIVTGGEPAIGRGDRPAKATASSARVLPPTVAVQPPARLSGPFAWPVEGAVLKGFGPGKSGERNDGITIAVPLDTPVRAAADGVVVYVGDDVPALGGIVILKHGDDYATVYGHASQLLVQRGQSVKRGQEIALSGDTGFADRPELHFEIRKGRKPIDPMTKLPHRS
ncbi:peptidoglycan DD-metalloendopeptidase family protein [Stakelama marina]|nr:peptidoglycan DD-metalloendopeptidase family protein [Stakelama marina]